MSTKSNICMQAQDHHSWKSAYLFRKYYTRLERIAWNKRPSLFGFVISDGEVKSWKGLLGTNTSLFGLVVSDDEANIAGKGCRGQTCRQCRRKKVFITSTPGHQIPPEVDHVLPESLEVGPGLVPEVQGRLLRLAEVGS